MKPGTWRAFPFLLTLTSVVLVFTSACGPSSGSGVAPAVRVAGESVPVDPTPEPVDPTPEPQPTPLPPTPTAVPTLEAQPTPAPTAQSDRYAKLRAAIESELAKLNGDWSIGVQDLKTGDLLLIDPDQQVPAASQYKLLLLHRAFREIHAGRLDLDQMTTMRDADYVDSLLWDEELKPGNRVSVRGILRVMVIQSSNAAAHALSRLMGVSPTGATIDAEARLIGLSQTRTVDRLDEDGKPTKTTVTSVRDLLQFYAKLYHGEFVSHDACREMLDLLAEQQINDRIPARLPRGTKVAHKTGNLPGVVNDGGIIFGPRTDVGLVVLNQGADYEQGTKAIGRIAEIVYQWHNG